MKFLFRLLLCILPMSAFAQDTTYFDAQGKKVETVHEADYCEMVVFPQGDSLTASLQQFFTDGTKKKEVNYTDFKKNKVEGTYRSWYRNGKQQREIHDNEGKKHGKLMTWWENGKMKRSDVYKNDSLVSGTCYDSTGNQQSYYNYEVMPEFPGGQTALFKFLSKEIRYPAEAREQGIQGKVYVNFYIDKNGNVRESKVLSSPAEDLGAEALRVINIMPQWKPGTQDGEKVSVMYNLPVSFRLR